MPEKMEQLPAHMIAVEQGAKYGEYYAMMLDLKVGECLRFTCGDFGEEVCDVPTLVNRVHSMIQTLHVRRGAGEAL